MKELPRRFVNDAFFPPASDVDCAAEPCEAIPDTTGPALLLDDQCAAGDIECGLNALQMRGMRKEVENFEERKRHKKQLYNLRRISKFQQKIQCNCMYLQYTCIPSKILVTCHHIL